MIRPQDLAPIPTDGARALLESVRAADELVALLEADAEPPVETCLLDADGVIVWVDDAWRAFCLDNGGDPARCGVGRSYLALCDAAAPTDGHSAAVASAIRAALAGDLPAPARVAVPCHAPTRARVLDVLISSRRDDRGAVLGATVTLCEAVPAPVARRPGSMGPGSMGPGSMGAGSNGAGSVRA